MATGTLKLFFKDGFRNYGFINTPDGEVYVHAHAFLDAWTAQPGDPVTFDLEHEKDGRPRAANVRFGPIKPRTHIACKITLLSDNCGAPTPVLLAFLLI
jgi:cold shock CspA family protein